MFLMQLNAKTVLIQSNALESDDHWLDMDLVLSVSLPLLYKSASVSSLRTFGFKWSLNNIFV